jgi:outer membrane protein
MKMSISKSLLIFLFLFSGHVLYAQTGKGKFLAGGQYVLNFASTTNSISDQSNSNVTGKYRTLSLSPRAGYFFLDNVPAGLEFLYTYARSSDGSSTSHSSEYFLIPFIRYYFGKSAIKPYLQAGAGPGWKKGSSVDFGYTSTSESKLFRYELSGGLAAFINEHISIDLGLSYKTTSESFQVHTTVGSPSSRLLSKNLEALAGFVICL